MKMRDFQLLLGVIPTAALVLSGCSLDCEELRNCTPYAGPITGDGAGGTSPAAGGGGGTGGNDMGGGGQGGGEGGSPPVLSTISAGTWHTCGVLSSGEVYCWGTGQYGELGNGASGTGAQTAIPETVFGLSNVVDISAGPISCATRSDDTIACWGRGPVGDGTDTLATTTPVDVAFGQPVTTVSTGPLFPFSTPLYHACAVLADATVACWGMNNSGQAGVPSSTMKVVTPTVVSGLTSIASVKAGGAHTCALSTLVRCWGQGGKLGNGSTSGSSTPVTVLNLSQVTQIATGLGHSCARQNSGTLRCWGDGSEGQLGTGDNMSATSPVDVVGLTNVVSVGAGYYHSCALRANGEVWCWGGNSEGQLGDGTTIGSPTPTKVVNLADVTKLSVGALHACALTTTNEAWCWGYNGHGQLGNGDTTNRTTPTKVLAPW